MSRATGSVAEGGEQCRAYTALINNIFCVCCRYRHRSSLHRGRKEATGYCYSMHGVLIIRSRAMGESSGYEISSPAAEDGMTGCTPRCDYPVHTRRHMVNYCKMPESDQAAANYYTYLPYLCRCLLVLY